MISNAFSLEQLLQLWQGASSAVQQTTGLTQDVIKNLTSTSGDDNFAQSQYNFNQRMFPLDLGSETSYHGHYMVININVQLTTKMQSIKNRDMFKVLPDDMSKTDILRYNLDKGYSEANTTFSEITPVTTRPRFTRRIVESIALYMPNSELTFTDAHDYTNISLTKFAGPILGAGIQAIAAFGGGWIGGLDGAKAGANLVDAAGNIIGNAAQLVGTPINPKVEVLFANTFQREFAFDFIFSPSSQEESIAIQNIIRTLRFHAAPERRSGDIGSLFWVPPSEFDITFYNRGIENTALPRINTCVLKQIDVSYSPTGTYSTFRDGYPNQVRMMLRFGETEVVHKLRVAQGF